MTQAIAESLSLQWRAGRNDGAITALPPFCCQFLVAKRNKPPTIGKPRYRRLGYTLSVSGFVDAMPVVETNEVEIKELVSDVVNAVVFVELHTP